MRPWRRSPPSDDPRERLLERLRPHVSDARVLEAIRAVPRDRFVPARRAAEAWDNVALPIGSGQTISQPLVVARMCELLELSDDDRVLDVGTGSERAAASLAAAGVVNVTLRVGDGARGPPACAPYDAINVAAAMGRLPEALAGQLAPGGRLVGPVDDGDQRLIRLRRTAGGELERSAHERVRFVPLISPPPGS